MYEDVLIAGYSDRLSVRPGETIRFAVSSRANTNYQQLYSAPFRQIRIQKVQG